MVSIADFVDVALYTLKRIEINDKVNFKTFKKDREVEIEKIDKGLFNVSENGFHREVFLNLDEKELTGELKNNWRKIRQFRNLYIHETTGKATDKFPKPNESDKLFELNKEIETYIKWLKENEKNIEKAVKEKK